MTEKISQIVIEEAPLECPDRIVVRDNSNFPHKYQAYFNKNGEVECLGTTIKVCRECLFRIGSYIVDTPQEGRVRVPEGSVTHDPV